MNCFNCGKPLNLNSVKCPHCGYMPDVTFMKKCPNLKVATCIILGSLCKHLGSYQTCPVKNQADSECGY